MRIVRHSYLEIFAELFVEFLVVVLVFTDFVKQFHAFLDEILADDLQDLALLERFTRDVQRKIFGIDDALDEAQVFGDQLLAVVHDENMTNVQLDVVSFLLVFEHIKWGSFRDKEKRTEYELTLH